MSTMAARQDEVMLASVRNRPRLKILVCADFSSVPLSRPFLSPLLCFTRRRIAT
jgi:hypothetical protein